MKNKFLIIIFLSIIVLTGCFNNNLKCKMNDDKTSSKYILSFKDDKLTNLHFEQKKIYESLDALIELDYYQLVDTYSTLDNINGVKYKIKENKNDIKITLDVDYNTYKDNNTLINFTNKTTKQEVKSVLENAGYTCK